MACPEDQGHPPDCRDRSLPTTEPLSTEDAGSEEAEGGEGQEEEEGGGEDEEVEEEKEKNTRLLLVSVMVVMALVLAVPLGLVPRHFHRHREAQLRHTAEHPYPEVTIQRGRAEAPHLQSSHRLMA